MSRHADPRTRLTRVAAAATVTGVALTAAAWLVTAADAPAPALRVAAERMDDLSRDDIPLTAAFAAGAAAKRLDHWADELTDETGEQ